MNEISISQPVRIIVYESTESFSDNDYYVYNEEMVLELFVEGHNYVAFTRPSKFFSTAVDLNTLPYGFGITEQTHFFTTNDTEYVFRVERIQEVKLQKDGDEYYPVFLSEKGEELVSNYSISTRVISYKDNNDQSQIEITKEISLSYGGLSRLFTVLESISYANECEKNGLLYEYGFMAEDEYVQWVAETVLDGRLEVFNQDGTELYWTLYNFVSDNNCVTSAMEDALCKLSGQTRAIHLAFPQPIHISE